MQLQRVNRRRRKQSTARSSRCKLAWLQKPKASNAPAAVDWALALLAAYVVVGAFLPWAILAGKPMSLQALLASDQSVRHMVASDDMSLALLNNMYMWPRYMYR